MSFKTVQKQIQGEGHSKESAGKILGAAAQKAKHPSPNQRKVLAAQGKGKRPVKKAAAKKTSTSKRPTPSWMKKKD